MSAFRTATLALALTALAALPACKREATPAAGNAESASAEPAKTAASAPSAPANTGIEIENTAALSGIQPNSNAPAWYDAKTFPGTFAGQGTTLALAADGTYRITVHAQSANADLESAGTWTLQPDGKSILLDPDSKDEADRSYALVSADELRQDGGATLRRDAAR